MIVVHLLTTLFVYYMSYKLLTYVLCTVQKKTLSLRLVKLLGKQKKKEKDLFNVYNI